MNKKVLFGLVFFPILSQAAGLGGANDMLIKVQEWLSSLALVVVTIAFLWIGYKMLVDRTPFSEVSRIFIGAIIIGAASELASLLIG